ncbi:hypothetical protein GCM10022402_46400 [Salinactinospora qingdaonensis]|uniref:Transposase IS200-like domain-containing protein n=1 Tax=Salinactinospora qingdaonensis TaxID=702744 RepID=A0ABP7GEM5_9ACTN
MRSVRADFEVEPVEFNGEDDHVHLLVTFPPKVAVSTPVNSRKRGVLAPVAPGVPRACPTLPAGHATLVGLLLRRFGGRGPVDRAAPVHRTAGASAVKVRRTA